MTKRYTPEANTPSEKGTVGRTSARHAKGEVRKMEGWKGEMTEDRGRSCSRLEHRTRACDWITANESTGAPHLSLRPEHHLTSRGRRSSGTCCVSPTLSSVFRSGRCVQGQVRAATSPLRQRSAAVLLGGGGRVRCRCSSRKHKNGSPSECDAVLLK